MPASRITFAHLSISLLMIAPTPAHSAGSRREHTGLGLFGHLVDMIFTERAYQDITEIEWTNTALRGLADLARERGWGAAAVDDIKSAMGLEDRKVMQFATIRPLAPLPGGIFSGFLSKETRRQYVQIGMARATEVLDELGW